MHLLPQSQISCHARRRWSLLIAALGVSALISPVSAQLKTEPTSAPAPSSTESLPPKDEVIELTPFTVNASNDRGYQAQSTLGGSRLKSDLKDVASPTTAFTEQFLLDTAITNTDDLARYMLSTEYDFGEDAGGQNRLNGSTRALRIRGLSGGTVSVNFFKSDFPADTFNTERIDQSRGPNSVLFGIGSPGGIINVNTKRAILKKDKGEVSVQGRSEGGLRLQGDYNVAAGDKLAVRLAAVTEDRGSWRNYEFNDSDRSYATAKWRITPRTELNVDAEKSAITKQTKRTYTALDGYTLWRAAGSNLTSGAAAVPAQYIARIAGANVPWMVYDTATGTLTNWVNKTSSQQRQSVDGEAVALSDFSVLPKETAIYGPGFDQDTNYTRLGAYLTHAFTSNFNVELAALRTDSKTRVWDPQLAAGQVLKVDTNTNLPSGAANPNAGKPYFESIPQVNYTALRNDSVRMIASYKKELGWMGTHTLAGVYEYDFGKTDQKLYREQIISSNAPDLTAGNGNNNRIWRRTYVDLNGPSGNIVMAPFNDQALGTITESVSGRVYNTAFVPFNNNTQLLSYEGNTMIGMLQSAFWKKRIKTILGVSQDERDDYASTQIIVPLPGFTGANGGLAQPVRSHTPNSVTAHSVSFSGVFQVTDWLGLTYSQAANSSLPSFAGRLNTVTSDPTTYGRPPIPRGKSKDVGFKLDLFDKRLFVTASYFETAATRDFDFTTIAPTINLIWNALTQAGAVPSSYQSADTSTGQTFDSSTKGYEIELTANMTKNWRVFLNYSNEKTSRTNIGNEQLAYIAAWRPLWQSNSAVPLASGVGTVGTQLAALDALTFTNYTLADGKRPLGQIQHKLNLVTNYDFTSSALKGFSVGGGVRYLGKPVVGFTATGSVGNVVQMVYYGSEQYFVDVNAAYRRKINLMGRPVMWSLQTNINNVLNNDAFVRLRQASDGLLLNYKFNPPLEWVVTTKFAF